MATHGEKLSILETGQDNTVYRSRSVLHYVYITLNSLARLLIFSNYFFFPMDRWLISSDMSQSIIDSSVTDTTAETWHLILVMLPLMFSPLVIFFVASLPKKPRRENKRLTYALLAGIAGFTFLIGSVVIYSLQSPKPLATSTNFDDRNEEFLSKNEPLTTPMQHLASVILYTCLAGLTNSLLCELCASPAPGTESYPLLYNAVLVLMLFLSKSEYASVQLSNLLDVLNLPSLAPFYIASKFGVGSLEQIMDTCRSLSVWGPKNELPFVVARVVCMHVFLDHFPQHYSRPVISLSSSDGFDITFADARERVIARSFRNGFRMAEDFGFVSMLAMVKLVGSIGISWLGSPVRQLKGVLSMIRKSWGFLKFLGVLLKGAWVGGWTEARDVVGVGYQENRRDVWLAIIMMACLGFGHLSLMGIAYYKAYVSKRNESR